MLSALITGMLDLIVPPRPTELLVRTLTLDDLAACMQGDTLPYHEQHIQALVWELKYHASGKAKQLAGAWLGEQLLGIAAEELSAPLLIPVPMHVARLRTRGHNQTEVLCKAALNYLGGAYVYTPQALRRERDTKTQQGLPRAKRLINVKNSMRADKTLVAGRTCVVVDDVTTTGATLAEAKRALTLAGARVVHTIALAKS